MIGRRLSLLVLPVHIVVLLGCGSSPTVHFYTLSVEKSFGGSRAESATRELRIAVGPTSLPDVVDRPQFVVQSGHNEVILIDDHRWAQPLKSDITKVIAENLSRALGTTLVWAYPQDTSGLVDFRVELIIQRFESSLGRTAAIDALWVVKPLSQENADSKTGRSSVEQPVAEQGYQGIAAAHSRALAVISGEIAEAIRSLAFSRP